MEHTIKEQKECWKVIFNKDRTEGRGPLYVAYICWNESTAIRLAKGGCVQGSDGSVSKGWARKFEGDAQWYVPAHVEQMSKDDMRRERGIEAKRKNDAAKAKALDRARQSGMSDEDIALLRTP